ncbi:glmZ(sRNA)-inactivating NTPase [Aneurinibacillus migulanus]|uniref:GlmZ(SRNA)-inactivating NTPase n=2 Tax=Aneurinibacillus migulanus TaxID=47500 RepID=A0A0D1XVX5_ANEMI|nr:RNase adapter RapZ [Aneurinibacillus migulanus]KIV50027.1 glmZ(sRNA)-inactivating NTPase [Aneurinibacillus migulanus]KIV51207.1 glmZ(sRNA)-inactivating NTPase [Aneurinibacillus migulanus]KON94674.1 glmZ(sRNA)-inactivating NTPase [Aneurinibacillus migulanus]KPD04662.1 glmZ(sRNA)-inactivating NTPase [Aneurinibacillus migulanus]MCP1358436.1 RNase adapter RapZ [Aneurinibacillus migulanus]
MEKQMNEINLLIITGMSGAGKTVAIQKLEDLGFFCVDNLPPVLIPKFAELIDQSGGRIQKVALVIDLRGREFFDALAESLERVHEMENITYQIIFLDASDQTLVQRYKETRRNHPLAPNGLPLDGIHAERRLLEELKGLANLIIDTTHLKPVLLKEKISQIFSQMSQNLTVIVQSFGFKFGIPIDADLVFDVRFLPNPHYVETLRPKTGKEAEVSDYVFKWDVSQEFLTKLADFIDFTLPHYQQEGKAQLVIGIGCTGGKHRSVAIAEYLGQRYQDQYNVRITHRDIERGRS